MIFCCGWQVVCFKPKPINSFNLHNAKWNTLAAKIVLYLETDKYRCPALHWQTHVVSLQVELTVTPIHCLLKTQLSPIPRSSKQYFSNFIKGKKILKKDNHWTFQYLKKKYNIELLKTYVKCSIYIFYFIFFSNLFKMLHVECTCIFCLPFIYIDMYMHAFRFKNITHYGNYLVDIFLHNEL